MHTYVCLYVHTVARGALYLTKHLRLSIMRVEISFE